MREAELDQLMSQLARSRIRSEDAEDVAQTALLKVFSRASEFTVGKPYLPWFYAIVANEVQSSRRRHARLAHADEVPENTAVRDDDAETEIVVRELERALEIAIAALDDYAKLRLLLGGTDVH